MPPMTRSEQLRDHWLTIRAGWIILRRAWRDGVHPRVALDRELADLERQATLDRDAEIVERILLDRAREARR